jgi:hypothetical protein
MNISHMEKDCLKIKWNELIADGQRFSRRSLQKTIDFQALQATKNLGQFETVILNGTPLFDSTIIFKMLETLGFLPLWLPH